MLDGLGTHQPQGYDADDDHEDMPASTQDDGVERDEGLGRAEGEERFGIRLHRQYHSPNTPIHTHTGGGDNQQTHRAKQEQNHRRQPSHTTSHSRPENAPGGRDARVLGLLSDMPRGIEAR